MTKVIRYLAIFQFILLLPLLVSFELFINAEVAFLSSMLIMLGSMFSYYRLVSRRIEGYENIDEKDLIDKLDDPYDLYDEDTAEALDDADIKNIIKEEKKRIKTNGVKNTISSVPAMISLYRMIPYLFLVMGFIGLKNNGLLMLWPYLSGIAFGIVGGYLIGRTVFSR